MKTPSAKSTIGWLTAMLALLAAATVDAQTTPSAQPTKPAANKDEAVVLSPFEVNAASDTGYSATSTLAGTRLRTELRDVAASITVVTKDFMNDIGANNLDQLLNYTVGTEVAGLAGNRSTIRPRASASISARRRPM